MTISRSTALIATLSITIVLLLWMVVYFGRDEYQATLRKEGEGVATASSAGQHQGRPSVRVSPDAQRAGALELAKLAAGKAHPSVEVFGSIADLKPLLDARARFLAAQAEVRALRAAAANSAREQARLKGLYEDDRNVSERALREAEATARSDAERVTVALQQLAGIETAARAEWGATLTDLALDASPGGLAGLTEGRELIAQITIPYEHADAAARSALLIAPAGQRGARSVARYVSPAPQASQALPGVTYFYRANAAGLRVGMRVSGELRPPGAATEGVVVPEAAVVWHAGRAWCYVKEGDDLFVRVPVATSHAVDGGWFNATGFEEGQAVVVAGAQLLLSEELKYQIRNENED
jgi:hypothetical protein